MTLAALLGALTIIMTFVMSAVADRYGSEVASRFLERGKPYTDLTIKEWVARRARAASGYVYPVLFPLDLAFLLSFGSFMAAASSAALTRLEWLPEQRCIVLLLPTIYVVADLAEDMMLARFLTRPSNIKPASVSFTKFLTRVKIGFSVMAMIQTVILLSAALL